MKKIIFWKVSKVLFESAPMLVLKTSRTWKSLCTLSLSDATRTLRQPSLKRHTTQFIGLNLYQTLHARRTFKHTWHVFFVAALIDIYRVKTAVKVEHEKSILLNFVEITEDRKQRLIRKLLVFLQGTNRPAQKFWEIGGGAGITLMTHSLLKCLQPCSSFCWKFASSKKEPTR